MRYHTVTNNENHKTDYYTEYYEAFDAYFELKKTTDCTLDYFED